MNLIPIVQSSQGRSNNHKAGKIRILATSGSKRSPFVPDIPTFAESGFPDLVVEEWFGFYVPAKTPPNVIANANAAINAALKDKVVIDSLGVHCCRQKNKRSSLSAAKFQVFWL